MRKTLVSAISVFALLAAPTIAAAQQSARDDLPDADPAATAAASADVIAVQAENQVLSDTYIGAPVTMGLGEQAEVIGEVTGLIIDKDTRQIVGATVGVGGFLGIGKREVAVSWDALKVRRDGDETVLVTAMGREALEAAPAFKTQAELRAEQERAERQRQLQQEQMRMQQTAPTAPTPSE